MIIRKYCSRQCRADDRRDLERLARGLDRGPRRGAVRECAGCGSDIPLGLKADAKYCSHNCGCASNRRRRMAATAPIACSQCGGSFHPDKQSRRFCCHQCSVEATKKRKDINCAWCGKAFHPKTYTARFCSASCVAKAGHASGRLRHFPRKLTARAFERLLEQQRPKRLYRMRLTAKRFDKMIG